jgi:hypothetical protein
VTQTRDRRQEILDRLEALLSGMTISLAGDGSTTSTPALIPAGNFVRNRNELPADKLPGIILLDADEVNDYSLVPKSGRVMSQMATQILKMTPEIYIVLDTGRKPHNKNAGKDLNLARLAIMGKIIPDSTIQELCGSFGKVVYDGSITDFARNRVMKGQMGLSITFSYPLIAAEVVGR